MAVKGGPEPPGFCLPVGIADKQAFRDLIYQHYESHGRILPWRLTWDPYRIFVSEVMLQQTQVERVLAKYDPFVCLLPDFAALANASLDLLLRAWQGLGYNRRALSLKKAALDIIGRFHGSLPSSVDDLATLPGIGPATAASIAAFAFNAPVSFIETNIRTVFIHFFFQDRERVSDREILPVVAETLDRNDPRSWYYALMDYGTMLKKEGRKAHRKSAAYRRQTPFQGSSRQVRGAILRLLVSGRAFSEAELTEGLGTSEEKVRANLLDLAREGFVRETKEGYTIA
jgi:A/G-specific adenine glycosylase